MKRLSLIISCLFFLWFVQAQEQYLSDYFVLKHQFKLTGYTEENSRELVGNAFDSKIYFCKKRAFFNKETNYEAAIYVVDYEENKQYLITLPFPEVKKSANAARKYWIYGIFASEKQMLLATQSAVLIYKNMNGVWKLQNSIPIQNPDFVWIAQQKVFAITEDNRMGFHLWSSSLEAERMDSVAAFELKAHFLLQYGPNGFMKRNGNSLYFLNSPDFSIVKYNLEGEVMNKVSIQIPNSTLMPADYISKVNAMPYGSDRAMYAYYHSSQFTFPLEIFPLSDTLFLISYHEYDASSQKEALKMIILKMDTMWSQVAYHHVEMNFPQDEVIKEDAFPIYYNQPELCLWVPLSNGIAQISKETEVSCKGKTGKEYTIAKEKYLQNNPPLYLLKIMELKKN